MELFQVLCLESTRSKHEDKLKEVETCIRTMTKENQDASLKLKEATQQSEELKKKVHSLTSQVGLITLIWYGGMD